MRALIVDDSRAMRLLIARVPNELDFETTDAADGREARDRVGCAAPFDVVLIDWNMPRMSGYDFLREVRADPAHETVPIIIDDRDRTE